MTQPLKLDQGDDFCIEGWFNSNVTLDASVWNPIITLPWHGNDNDESQIWIGLQEVPVFTVLESFMPE